MFQALNFTHAGGKAGGQCQLTALQYSPGKGGAFVQIDIQMGPALDTLQHLLDAGEADTFDFAFIGEFNFVAAEMGP